MSGLYIHIPYCKKACHYCDFHFSTSYKNRAEMIHSICKEIELRHHELKEPINTIYFGGGTPSILNHNEFNSIFNCIDTYFKTNEVIECTIECNPDDLNDNKLEILRQLPFNRLSIGIQTFDKHSLEMLNRAHNSDEAYNCIRLAKKHGFDNITCDLIYGIPSMSDQNFKNDINTLIEFDIPHISAYCLTVEEKTALKKLIENKKIESPNEENAISQYEILIKELESSGYTQYEISNFSKPNYEAKHNTNYWKGKQYLGIGPSAHSYNISNRSFNLSNNNKYIQSLSKDILPIEREELSEKDKLNDYLLTRLRTVWGINLDELLQNHQYDLIQTQSETIEHLMSKNWINYANNSITLTEEGKLMADEVAMHFFID